MFGCASLCFAACCGIVWRGGFCVGPLCCVVFCGVSLYVGVPIHASLCIVAVSDVALCFVMCCCVSLCLGVRRCVSFHVGLYLIS